MNTRRTVLFLALMLLSAGHAWGQDAAETLAHERFLRGMARYDAGQFNEALVEFRASYATYASPNSRLFTARTLRELGRIPEAMLEFDTTLAEAAERSHADARYQATHDAAEEERRALEDRVGRVRIDVANAPAGVTLRLNGEVTPPGALGLPLAVRPGRVAVSVEAPGYLPATGEVTAVVGQRTTLALVLVREPSVSAATHSPAWFDPHWLMRGGGAARALAWTGYVTAALGLVGTVGFALGADATYHELQNRCGGGRCSASDQSTIDRGRALEALTNVSIGMAVVGAVAGTAFWAVGSRAESRPGVRLVVGPAAIGAAGTF